MTTSLADFVVPHQPLPTDFVINPSTIDDARRPLIPRFGDDSWPLTFTSDNPSVSEVQVHWATFPSLLRDQFRSAAWALVNFPVPDHVLAARSSSMRSRLSTLRIYHTITDWRTFAHWLAKRTVYTLTAVTTEVLSEYSLYLSNTRKVSRNTAINHLTGLTRLYVYGTYLTPAQRIGQPPWESEGIDDYLPAVTSRGENIKDPISPETMGPLLIWALRFVEDFGADILAARGERQRLCQTVADRDAEPAPAGTPPELAAFLDGLVATGQGLPALNRFTRSGKPAVAATYIAAITNSPLAKVHRALKSPKWCNLEPQAGQCLLDVQITATIDGNPWINTIDFDQVSGLTRHLATACFIVIAYLTGMRVSEILALGVGCCPDPEQGGEGSSSSSRHLIRGRQFKTARDEDGNHLSSGVERETPWIAVPQVVSAIRMLEELAEPNALLFATDRGTRSGRSLSFPTIATRIEDFIGWVNERSPEAIPPDPNGHIGTARFRRTLAWHIARRPGGLVALAVQYGHMRTLVSEGYAGRQRQGIHELLDFETARAVAEHLTDVNDALDNGHGVSGPAARRLIYAAREKHHRFGGIITTQRQARALLSDPALTVFENPDAYLTCNYDPDRALCKPGNSKTESVSTPCLDRCQGSCPNVARTDNHAAQLRSKAEQLRIQANSQITPLPVADRLSFRAAEFDEIADRHDRTRIAATDEDAG